MQKIRFITKEDYISSTRGGKNHQLKKGPVYFSLFFLVFFLLLGNIRGGAGNRI